MPSASESKLPHNSLEKTLKEIEGLISLPEIYLKFRQLMDDPNSSNEDFSALVGCDPNLSATVLKIVNSALFGFPGQIDNISRAINLLGIGQLHDMVLGTSAIASLDFPNDIVPLKTFWRSSLFSGVLARLLASQLKIQDSECFFVIGLLHEIGHLILYAKYREQSIQAIANFNEGNQTLAVAEQNILGFHYGQAGANLMAQWRLPTKFQVMTYYQPTPTDAPLHPLGTALIHLAHGYAQKYLVNTGQNIERLIVPEAWKILDLNPKQVEITLEKAKQVSADMEKAILR
ncbi:MAG: HDOD domain-containing protein [Methyloglobulus sp.]|nr:HDOD domain-containing protein [Methyloglobulus sp.]